MTPKDYRVIGLMSGTSLDGLDIAYCHISENNGNWTYQIINADCIRYSNKWQLRLQKLVFQDAITYLQTHVQYGHLLGDMVNTFIAEHDLKDKVDFIVSHGQTIYHQPENKMTAQIGDGAAISVKTGLPVISDLRTCDVAAGGQGAPIVPICDKILFSEHLFCLNLGGIANISCKLPNGNIIGYDISGANIMLNRLANDLNLKYDDEGAVAADGLLSEQLLHEMNAPHYFNRAYPKSLSAGWVRKSMGSILAKYKHLTVADRLRTTVEHIAMQVAKDIKHIAQKENISISPDQTLLVTGGGALNTFLVERIASLAPIKTVVPDSLTVKFKEALAMAFIGVLRLRQEHNCLSAVTGAEKDVIGGAIYCSQPSQLSACL
jgi:anhydro-N-acetylmuramic acid kinase